MNFSESIYKLRKKLDLSQEDFAERIGISRKALQNWESGASVPDSSSLVAVSRAFDVSIDYLLLGTDARTKEEHFDKIAPTKDRHAWECYEKDLYVEYEQCIDEGKAISQYEKLLKEIAAMPASRHKEKMADLLFDIICEAPTVSGYKYCEPSDYESIKALSDSSEPKPYDKESYREKLRGAWTGRICGCFLGKPIEGIRTPDLKTLLKDSGNYPMYRYIKCADITDETDAKMSFHCSRNWKNLWVDTTDLLPIDDDTNYTVLSNIIVRDYGRNFTPVNVLDAWLNYQPKDAYCTAERVAWKNYFNGYMPPMSALYKNPYREYIGAQIRVDYYGYINPGDPDEAARMAFNDASISHVKNGIYGAMYVAAMTAEAAVCSDTRKIVEVGLSKVPKTSRLYEEVGEVARIYDSGKSLDECRAYINSRYDEWSGYGWCHTNSNAMIVTMALLYFGNDIGKAMCAAVETGFDTDCNGATVGSVMGMMLGASKIPAEWAEPMTHDLQTAIRGFERVGLEFLVDKTLEQL